VHNACSFCPQCQNINEPPTNRNGSQQHQEYSIGVAVTGISTEFFRYRYRSRLQILTSKYIHKSVTVHALPEALFVVSDNGSETQ